MTEWDFSSAKIELRAVEHMWPSRWCATLSIPCARDDLLALESPYFARTREGAIKKAQRSLASSKRIDASRETVRP